jgi:hypothetical protein
LPKSGTTPNEGHDLEIVVDNENRGIFQVHVTQCEAYATNVTPALSGERKVSQWFRIRNGFINSDASANWKRPRIYSSACNMTSVGGTCASTAGYLKL